jgi:hypothetical protein
MRQLNPGHRSLLGNKRKYAPQRLNVRVRPESEILWADAAVRRNRSGFGDHGGGASHRPAAQVDEMPVSGKPVLTGILAHGRDHNAVRKFHTANLERIK